MSSWGVAGPKAISESMHGDDATTVPTSWLPTLSRVPFFQGLSKRHLRRVAHLAELKRFEPGSRVVRAGARGDAFYVILDGHAHVETPAGHTHELGEADYFGELALLDGAPRSATVTAISALTTVKIGRTAFLKLLREEPAIGVGLAHGLVAIVRELQEG